MHGFVRPQYLEFRAKAKKEGNLGHPSFIQTIYVADSYP
jgi:hypothetical protein